MPKLTKRTVDAATPKAARYFLWDDALPGFGLVIQSSGVKSFCYQYRTPEGRSRRIAIGRHGPLTPDQAREKARSYQRAVLDGRDPLGEKQARRNAVTVADVLDAYLESPKFAQKAASTQAIDRGRIERHLKPLLGKTPADKLSSDGVRRAFQAIKAGKTAVRIKTGKYGLARVTGGEGAARMTIRLLKAIYTWAVEEKLVTHNPTAGVKVGKDGRRDLILTPEEYEALFAALDRLESVCALRRPVADAIRVIALTGARRGEIAGLKWGHVNLKKRCLEIPASSHKTGGKTGESRIIGLPAAAQALIVRQKGGRPDDYVFRPAHREGVIQLSKPWRKVRAEAGLNPAIGLHGLRHSLASNMALSGAQAGEIMAVMGHRSLSTSQRYVHFAADVRAELAERAAVGISAALEGRKPGDVVKMNERAEADGRA